MRLRRWAIIRYDRAYSFQSGPHTRLGARLIKVSDNQWIVPWLGSAQATFDSWFDSQMDAWRLRHAPHADQTS